MDVMVMMMMVVMMLCCRWRLLPLETSGVPTSTGRTTSYSTVEK